LIKFTLYGISRRFIQRYNCDVNITLNCTSCKILYKFDRLSTKIVSTTSPKELMGKWLLIKHKKRKEKPMAELLKIQTRVTAGIMKSHIKYVSV
jgi:hypothetical protein